MSDPNEVCSCGSMSEDEESDEYLDLDETSVANGDDEDDD